MEKRGDCGSRGARLVILISLTKHHGLGNDFLIAIDPPRPLTADDAIAWCDRRRGMGADGLIEVTSNNDNDDAAQLWSMTLFNADGSKAEISGNGIRCVGQAIADSLGVAGEHSALIRTDAGLRTVHVRASDGGTTRQVRVDMGPAGEGPAHSDAWATLGVWVDNQAGLDLGNPHLVALVDDPMAIDMGRIGPVVEADYPDGLNVHVVRVDNPSTVTMNIWERGAGLTEACGSGACAAAAATHSWGLTESIVKVNMPGGSAEVEVGDTIFLTGPATLVGEVVIRG